MIYFLFLRKKFNGKVSSNDALNRKVIDIPGLGKNCCSWWPISHFVFFFLLSYTWPQYWLHMVFLGIVWEVYEVLYGKAGNQKKFKKTRVGNNKIEYEKWWSSSAKDILFNGMGILLGTTLR
jgi:hypothetical protein